MPAWSWRSCFRAVSPCSPRREASPEGGGVSFWPAVPSPEASDPRGGVRRITCFYILVLDVTVSLLPHCSFTVSYEVQATLKGGELFATFFREDNPRACGHI